MMHRNRVEVHVCMDIKVPFIMILLKISNSCKLLSFTE